MASDDVCTLLWCVLCGYHRPRDGVCMNVMSGQNVTFSVSVDVTECTEELQAGPKE